MTGIEVNMRFTLPLNKLFDDMLLTKNVEEYDKWLDEMLKLVEEYRQANADRARVKVNNAAGLNIKRF